MASVPIRRAFFDLVEKDVDDIEKTAVLRRSAFRKSTGWDDVLQSRLILLLSEAQSGKTYECQTLQQKLWKDDQAAFYVELASVAAQPWEQLRTSAESERLDRWRRTESEVATVFLDSLDELALTQGKFRAALQNVARDLEGHMARVRIVLTSRPLPVDRELFLKIFAAPKAPARFGEQDFASLALGEQKDEANAKAEPPEVRYVSLLPLTVTEVGLLAADRGVADTDAFVEGLRAASMLDLMRRPQDVFEAASAWQELGGKFGTHAQQVAFDVTARLKPNATREDRDLAGDRAQEGAKRLALAVVLTQRLTIRHDVNSDLGDAATVVDPSVILHEWRSDERKALLERGLFGFASYGRVRFHNRLAFEFLAAHRLADLVDQGMSRKAVRRLLVVQTAQGFDVIRPSMRDVTAWLALRQPWVFELVSELDPALLMTLGDPGSLRTEQRQKLLRAYVARYGKGGWRGLSIPTIQVRRIAHEDLGPIIEEEFDAVENPEVRRILLELIGEARIAGCASFARHVIQDQAAGFHDRAEALDALIALDDPELASVVAALQVGTGQSGHEFTRFAIYRLFPRHMSIAQLAAFLGWIRETKSIGSGLSRNLPPLAEQLEVGQLEELRAALTPLVEEGIGFDRNKDGATTNRPHLVHLLAATCALLLKADAFAVSRAYSIALAAELSRTIRSDESVPRMLFEALPLAAPAIRAAVFDQSVALARKLRPEKPRLDLFMDLVWRGALTLKPEDAPWIRERLVGTQESADLRGAALLMEIFVFSRQGADPASYLGDILPLLADDPELTAFLAKYREPRRPGKQERRWAICEQRRGRQRERRKAKARASWIALWRELSEDPDLAFSEDRVGDTAWNLWRVMKRAGSRDGLSGWNRRLLENHLGKGVADRLRAALMPLWRREAPSLASELPPEERNTYYEHWILALAGIAAEAEDPHWASRLSPDEVETALRYVPHNHSDFPAWLDALAQAHPDIVERVLGGEVSWTLAQPAREHGQGLSILVQSVGNASPQVATLFLPRLRSWLKSTGGFGAEGEEPASAARRLDQVIQIFLKFGDDADRERLAEMAAGALGKGTNEPFTCIWLPTLFTLDPEAAVDRLEGLCANVEVSRESSAVGWIAELFGGLRYGRGVALKNRGIKADILLRLLRLAYRHVDRSEDAVHEGSYSPDLRDDAESGRNMLLDAVMSLEGAEGWAVKQAVAEDPEFAHLRDRLRALAVEKSAREADTQTMRPQEVVKLDSRKEPGPRSSAEMFALMMDRLDDLKNHLLEDASPRELWASTQEERLMRKAIAGHLEARACAAYTVGQENVTAEEKETDIRLRSVVDAVEGVIELKIGDKDYSVGDLRRTISEQLVNKYLAPAGRRAGCLLITRVRRDRWNHPETGEPLDFGALIDLLKQHAKAYQSSFPDEIHIDVVGLDLVPRLSTERVAKGIRGSNPATV